MASSLEFNKALAAVLTAGIIASGAGVFSRIIYHPHIPEERAYPINMAAVEASGEESAGEQEQAMELSELLATASADMDSAVGNGQAVAKKCAACHTFEEGGANKIGPHLWGVVGRDIASVSDFSYSAALSDKEGEWTYEKLNEFLTSPKAWAPGTKMTFAGISKPQDRIDVILYLRSLAAEPAPLPESG